MRHCKTGQKHANLLLHTALRNKANAVVRLGNCNVMPIVACTFAKMSAFTDAMHSGSVRGGTGKKLTTVIVIASKTDSSDNYQTIKLLQQYCGSVPKILFAQDAEQLDSAIIGKNLESILFLVLDRLFCEPTILELMEIAKQKLMDRYMNAALADSQLFAVTASRQNAIHNGISKKNIFLTPSWQVNGFSIWSSLGLPLSLAIGVQNYKDFLEGAFEVDQYVTTEAVTDNILLLTSINRILAETVDGSNHPQTELEASAGTLERQKYWSATLTSVVSGIAQNITPKYLGAVLAIVEHFFIHEYMLRETRS